MSFVHNLVLQEGLSGGGIAMMVVCIGFVISLGVFCVVKLLGEDQPSEHHHAPIDIDTHDRDD